MRRFAASALAVALFGLARIAHAETPPSAWDRAKRPEVQDEYQLHLTVRQVWESEKVTRTARADSIKAAMNTRVVTMLQAAGAATSKNPLLRFDLAQAYIETEDFARAAETFKAAMRDFPDHPQTRHSRFELAIACGHTGDHECEERMYRAVIAESTSPGEITTPLLNLAETEMHNHELREAIEDYREGFRLCGFYQASYETPALILWGLAVALDRAGEVREADESAQRGTEMAMNSIELLRSKGVFFFPEYEVNWYEGLTLAAAAKRAQVPRERFALWLQAERRMAAWVAGGEKKKDYWLPIAKARLETYTKERKLAEVAAAKSAELEEDDPSVPVPQPQPSRPPLFPSRPPPRPPLNVKPPKVTPKHGDTSI